MSDLTEQQSSIACKITGASLTGTETNYLNIDSSGNATANQGLPNTTANAWPAKVSDGTNTAAVKASSTLPLATDPALVVTLSPNSSFGNATTPMRVAPLYQGTKVRFDDMNVANGGVARGTGIASTSVYTVLYNYSGSGELFSFLVGFEGNLIGADDFNVKLEIDSVVIFTIDTLDIGTAALYNLNTIQDEGTMGFSLVSNVLRFSSPSSGGLYYASNIKISIKKATSATSKQFRAGAIYLTKET